MSKTSGQQLRLWALILIIGTLILDFGVWGAHYLAPQSTRESDSNFLKNPIGNGALLVRLGKAKGKRCDLIFIGASNVEFWNTVGQPVWDRYYEARHAFNFGVAGDKTENVLWRFDHMDLSDMHPRAAVIFVGLNNFGDTPREIALGVKAVTKKTRDIFPGVKVLLVSQTPSARNGDQVIETNRAVRELADDKEVFYIDLYARMPRSGDNWKGLQEDRTHLSLEGYQMWAEEMEPVLDEILPQGAVRQSRVGQAK